jgi:hypothetical protein
LNEEEFTYDVASEMIQEQEETYAGQKIKLIDVYRKPDVYYETEWSYDFYEGTFLVTNTSVKLEDGWLELFTVVALHLNVLLRQRVVDPESAVSTLSGNVETIMKQLVSENLGIACSDTTRIVPNLGVVGSHGVSGNVNLEVSRKNLFDLLSECSEQVAVDFLLYRDISGNIWFDVKRPWGTNRSYTYNWPFSKQRTIFTKNFGLYYFFSHKNCICLY